MPKDTVIKFVITDKFNTEHQKMVECVWRLQVPDSWTWLPL